MKEEFKREKIIPKISRSVDLKPLFEASDGDFRIVSNGTETKVICNGIELKDIVNLSWSMDSSGKSKVNLTLSGIDIDLKYGKSEIEECETSNIDNTTSFKIRPIKEISEKDEKINF